MKNSKIVFGKPWSISHVNISGLILVSLCLKIFLSYLFHFIANNLSIKNIGSNDFSILETIVAVIIIAPLIETLIFQFGIQELIFKLIKISDDKLLFSISITISSLLFSITHYGSLFQILIAFTSGLIYATLYTLLTKVKFQTKLFRI